MRLQTTLACVALAAALVAPAAQADPFDRLLVAQAQLERVPILTADRQIAEYDIDALWAGTGPSPW